MDGTCLYCTQVPECPLLVDSKNTFDLSLLITEANFRDCSNYEPVMARERDVRERAYNAFGIGHLRALHELPRVSMSKLRQGEEDELMYENLPDFQDPTLLWEGMTSIEREDVLRHHTDEQGRIVVDVDSEGVEHKLPRPEYHIKAYLVDPNGPVHADKSVAWLWNINQVVEHILKCEAEAGLIVKVKKTKAAVAQPTESETEMAEAKANRNIKVVRSGTPAPAQTAGAPQEEARRANPKPPAAAPKPAGGPVGRPPVPAVGGRVATPPQRTVGAPQARGAAVGRPAGVPAPAKAAPVEAEAVASVGLDVDQLEQSVYKVVNPMIADLQAKMKELQEAISRTTTAVVDSITIFHDIASQTAGTFMFKKVDDEGNYVMDENGDHVMEYGPQLFPKKSKIYAYVDGTAYSDDEEAPVEGE
jgi:hypothetical protein